MKDNTRCFILAPDGYEEISYAELARRRMQDSTYTRRRFIPLHGMLMEVSEAEYRRFYRDRRRQKYLAEEAAKNGEVSYHALGCEGIIKDSSPSVEEQVSNRLMAEELRRCLAKLNDADKRLLSALYLDGKGERAVAKELGITQQAVNKQRHCALSRLRRLMGE